MSYAKDPAFLPLPLTRFFGRTREIAAVAAALRSGETRLVTLLGPGGVGKTRLALQVAAEVQERYAHGARFVPLSAVRDPSLVLPSLVVALGIEGDDDLEPAKQLREHLKSQEMLLVLDNLEQVVAVGAALGKLLAACPRLTMVITSRIPLRVAGEHRIPVAPFPVADVGNGQQSDLAVRVAGDAIALFADRAAMVLPSFELSERNVAHVATVCHQCDGLPLAIELAAARLRVLSPGELAARLEGGLQILGGGAVDTPDRLQTMRNAVAWSYDLLDSAQQALFRWLSVFVGGFDVSAVEGVADRIPGFNQADMLDHLCGLVDASLVQRGEGPAGDARFIMLETIREFGLERLIAEGEEEAARDAHAAWCVAFAELAGAHLAGPEHLAWWNRVAAELGNIRGAHTWLFARRDAERALRLGTALAWFWAAPGYYAEGRTLFRQLIDMAGAASFPVLLARVLNAAGNLEHWLDHLDAADVLYKRQLKLSRERHDTPGIVSALRALGSIAVDRDDMAAARRVLNEGLALAMSANTVWEGAAIANLLGIVAFSRGEYETAARRSEEAIASWRVLDDSGHAAAAQVNLARALLAKGDARRAAENLSLVLEVVEPDVGDDWVTSDCFDVAASIAITAHNATQGAQLLAAAEAMFGRMSVRRRPCFQAFIARQHADARARLGARAYAAETEKGTALPIGEAVALAQSVASASWRGPRAAVATDNGLAALTPREQEVLRLVAAGQSDKEIAAVLGVTRPTASNHVANIRAKLGAPSRAALAVQAVRDGFL